MTPCNRTPAGIPTGGQFSARTRSDGTVNLAYGADIRARALPDEQGATTALLERKYGVPSAGRHGARGPDEPEIETDEGLDYVIAVILYDDAPADRSWHPLNSIAAPIIVDTDRAVASLRRLVDEGAAEESSRGWRLTDAGRQRAAPTLTP